MSKNRHECKHGVPVQGINPRDGAPKIRKEWVEKRNARGDRVQTQQHYAKKGIITEEMAFCAARERMDPEFVRKEARALSFLPTAPPSPRENWSPSVPSLTVCVSYLCFDCSWPRLLSVLLLAPMQCVVYLCWLRKRCLLDDIVLFPPPLGTVMAPRPLLLYFDPLHGNVTLPLHGNVTLPL